MAPLRFFRVEALRTMLESDPSDEKKYMDVRLLQILRRLESDTDVVRWDNGRNAYVTASVVRKVMNQVNRMEDEAQFQQSHQRALEMYWDLADRYPENSPVYLAEIFFHQAMLDRLQKTSTEQQANLQHILARANELAVDQRMILPKRIEGDVELEELLSKEMYQDIKRQLEALLPES
jgi:hypothetical protein